jgi:DNA/RNA endonuclease YhcR with UshA esterase domain
MRRCGKIYFTISLILLFVAPAACEQGKKAVPKFDPANQTTITGVIDQMSDYRCPISGTIGSHLTVSNPEGAVEVHLAASKFLKEYGFGFAKGDTVKVTGTKAIFDGKPAMLARQVKVGKRTYFFRDEKGIPLW